MAFSADSCAGLIIARERFLAALDDTSAGGGVRRPKSPTPKPLSDEALPERARKVLAVGGANWRSESSERESSPELDI